MSAAASQLRYNSENEDEQKCCLESHVESGVKYMKIIK